MEERALPEYEFRSGDLKYCLDGGEQRSLLAEESDEEGEFEHEVHL